MPELFGSIDDNNMRLMGTVIRLKNSPIMVLEFSGEIMEFEFLRTNKSSRVPIDDERINIKPVPLGYVYDGSRCGYLMRVPRRRYKQGLELNATIFNGRGINYNTRNLADTIQGRYSPLSSAYEEINNREDIYSIPFSRQFCLVRNVNDEFSPYLGWKGYIVGNLNRDTGRFDLLPNWSFLEGTIEEKEIWI